MGLHKNIRLLSWFNFLLDFRLYAAVASIYFSQVTGSFALGMSVFSIIMLSTAIFEIPTGVFSDYIGRKKTIILGSFVSVASIVFYAIGGTYLMLAIGAVFAGIARSLFSGNNDALLYDTLSESKKTHEYHEYLGKVSSMFQIALAISAVLGGVIAHWSFTWVMWISVVPRVGALVVSFFFDEPKVQSERSGNVYAHLKDAVKQFIKNRRLRYLSLASMIGYGFGESSFQFKAIFVNTLWPVWAVGVFRFLNSAWAWASFYSSGKLINKFSEIKILLYRYVYLRVINIVALIANNVISPLLMTTPSLFYGVGTVAKKTLMQREFTQPQRATMGSLDSLGGSIFYAGFSLLIGLVADRLGPKNSLLVIQVIGFSILWFYWKFSKIDKKG